MMNRELALWIYERRAVVIFLICVGFAFLLVFGQQIVDALCNLRRGKKEKI